MPYVHIFALFIAVMSFAFERLKPAKETLLMQMLKQTENFNVV